MPDQVKNLIKLVSGLPEDDCGRKSTAGAVINVRRREGGSTEEIFVRAGYDTDKVINWIEEGGHQGKAINRVRNCIIELIK